MATQKVEPRTAENRLGRRGFLVRAAGGLSLGFLLPEVSRFGEAEAATPGTVNAWLYIGTDETVRLTIGASEMGQGSYSGLAQILAEELMVDYSRIQTVQAPPIPVLAPGQPQPPGYSINTVGSSVIRTNFWKMRDAAAAAREMLLKAAMNLAGSTDRSKFTIVNGVITYQGTTQYTYGQLANAAALLTPPTAPPLVPDNQWKVIGHSVPRVDIPSKVDGSAKYGIDIQLPGMLYAVVKHCPTFGGTVASVPPSRNGYTVVPLTVIAGTGRGTEVTGAVNAVAVVGPTTWDAWQAARSLNVSWNIPPAASNWNNAKFLSDAQALAANAPAYVAGGANPPGTRYTVEGSAAPVNAALASSAKKLDVTYTLPYVAHACMEVLNCTVNIVFSGNVPQSCEIYAPTQSAKGVLTLAATITGLTVDKIAVHTTYLGGGLGRKAEQDFVSQAIQVAMAVKKPVKLMWPREQDFTRDQYRPMALVHAQAGLDNVGNITGWAYRNVSPSILGQRGVPLGATGDSQGIEGAQALPYNIGARLTEWVSHTSPIPVGFWRSVGASINTFAVESLIDELAAAALQDPYLFRRSKLTDPRWIAVLDAAAALGNWTSAPPSGHARGIAIGTAFGSIVAEVVEVANATPTSLRVVSVSVAIDCYVSVNPGQVQAQLQGGVVHGLNAALFGQQVFVNGAAQNSNFNRNRMIKIGEMPQVNTKIIPNPSSAVRTMPIGGVGELGVPTLAPALANAYAKLTGKRVRSLPFFPGSTMSD